MLNWELYGFVRETNKKVFFRDTAGNEGKIYDFNINFNDTIFISNPRFMMNPSDSVKRVVQNIDSVYLINKYYQRFFLSSTVNSYFDEIWIAGIGSLNGLINSGYELIGMEYSLLCYSHNDTLFYHNQNYSGCYYIPLNVNSNFSNAVNITISPNPVSKNSSISINGLPNNCKIEILDIYGRNILTVFPLQVSFILNTDILNSNFYIIKVYDSFGLRYFNKLIIN